MSSHKTNEWYIDGIREQSRSVSKALVSDFFPMIKDYILNNSGNDEDAKDIFKDALEVILRKIQNNDLILTCKLSTYIYTICQNLWNKELRKKTRYSEVTIDHPSVYNQVQQSPEAFEKTEEYQLMREKFAELSEKCQRILELSWHTDLSGEAIAKKMKVTYGYLRKRKSICISTLTELVKKDPRYAELSSLIFK